MTNPLVATAGPSSTSSIAGITIAEDLQGVIHGVSSGSWVEAGLGMVGVASDVAAAVVDPIGYVASCGFGWLMEHVQPLSDALDALAGNPDEVMAHAATWDNIYGSLGTARSTFGAAVNADLPSWRGEAAEAYIGWAQRQATLTHAAELGAQAMRLITEGAGMVVAAVRMMTRDLIATVLGKVVSWAAEVVFSLGLATPLVVTQVATTVNSTVQKISRWFKGLISSMGRLGKYIEKTMTALKGIGKEGRGGSAAAHGAGDAGSAAKAVDNAADGASGTGRAADAAGSNPSQASRGGPDIHGEGDPVDAATGEVFLEQVDLSLPGALPVVISRRYRSQFDLGRFFGPRWASTFDEHVEISDKALALVRADGSILRYPVVPVGESALPQAGRSRWLLNRVEERRFTVTDPLTGRVSEYAGAAGFAWLVEQSDRAGRWVRFERDEHGVPVSVTHHGGYEVAVATEGTQVTGLTVIGGGPNGADTQVARYDYSPSGLVGFTGDGRTEPMTMEYDDENRMTAWTDAVGVRYVYRYDGEGRCASETGAGGVFRYRFDYETDWTTGEALTMVTNSVGDVTTFRMNSRSLIVAQTDPTGATTQTDYDQHDRPIATIDAFGAITRTDYDEVGRIVSVTNPAGSSWSIEYNDAGDPITVTDPLGAVVTREFDPAGQLIGVTDPSGAHTRITRGADAIDVVDPTGRATRVQLNAADLPVAITDGLANVSRAERDGQGRVIRQTDPTGAVSTFDYSPAGKLLAAHAADGSTQAWAYDAEGNLVKFVDAAGKVTTHEIGSFDVRVATTGPDGARLEFGYDTERRLTEVTNAAGKTWRYSYDGAGNVVGERDYDGRATTYARDLAGRVVGIINPAGERVELELDVLGQMVARRVDGAATAFSYDALGRLLSAVGPDAHLTRSYDAAGRMLSETTNGRTVAYGYDEAGRSVSRALPSGVTSQWGFDAAGTPDRLTFGGTNIDLTVDAAGRVTAHSFAGGVISSGYDIVGRLTSRAVSASTGVVGATPGVDIDGPTPIAGPDAVWGVQYSYHAGGELAELIDSAAGKSSFALDEAGRIASVTRAGATVEAYSYDADGNITAAADRPGWTYDGSLVTSDGRDRYAYDEAGRLVSRTRVLLSGGSLRWEFAWDGQDRLVRASTPDGEFAYRYDALGRRVAKERLTVDGSVAASTVFVWDGFALVEQHVGASSTALVSAGAPALEAAAPVMVTSWEHLGYAPIAQVTFTGPTGHGDGTESGAAGSGPRAAPAAWSQEVVDARFAVIVTDLIGAPVRTVSNDGITTDVGQRSIWGAHLGGSDSDVPLRFPGQYADVETGLFYNVFRYYNPDTGRFLTLDPLGLSPSPNPAAYPTNPVTQFDPLGLSPYSLETPTDDAVFWSGIGRNGDETAANWVQANGGATLETTMSSRGIKLPDWDGDNPAVVQAWRDASKEFAAGAKGNVRVLQGDAVGIRSVWAEVEFPALVKNPNVTSITAINPVTGEAVVIWRR